MISMRKIAVIARFEAKILLRSWFFRIFSLLALVILVFLNIGLFATNFSRWMYSGIPSYIPYVNLLLINVAQAAIGIFMASDFLKYDSKLDTTDVIYMRSMTNTDYVLGKTLGVFTVFGGLNLLVLINALVFNIFFVDVPFIPQLYILYPLLISAPTLLFIFGLTFLIMVLIRNQAVTFILLLGYIAITMFFLGNKFHYIFDYMAFSVPLMYSDFVGFGNLTTILMHRGIYLLLGIGFIFSTMLLLRRLSQSRLMDSISLVVAICSFLGAFSLGYMYLGKISSARELRSEISALNKKELNTPEVTVKSCNLDLVHAGNEIEVTAQLEFSNDTDEPVNRYLFSLNPGFEVTGVTHNGENSTFTRTIHQLVVEPARPLDPGRKDSITVSYHGTVNEDACYMDVDEDELEKMFRIMFYAVDKRYAFITPEYVLLTPENLWYPVAGIPYGTEHAKIKMKNFTRYKLSVKTAGHLTAISQGACNNTEQGVFVFTPEVPLPQISLAIGQYEKLSTTVDDIEYAVYYLKGHNYFSQYFPNWGEDYTKVISDTKNSFENTLGLEYPYKRACIVETPIQFIAYSRKWTKSTEMCQPEQIFIAEKAVTLDFADFRMSKNFMTRRSRFGRSQMSEEEMLVSLFRRFLGSIYSEDTSQSRTTTTLRSMRRGGGLGGGNIFRALTFSGTPSYIGSYSIFPLYYTHAYNFSSDKWPIFNTAVEYYLSGKLESGFSGFARMIVGLSDEEWANNALKNKSFKEILSDPENEEDMYDVIDLKSTYLFSLLKSEIGNAIFDEFFMEFLTSRTFSDIKTEEFITDLDDEFWIDLEPYFNSWLEEKQLPAFIITDLDCYEILDGNIARYQVIFNVSNPESVDGLIGITFRLGGGGMGGGPGGGRGRFMMFQGNENQEDERFYQIKAGGAKQIGIVLDSQPRSINIDTFISQNLPAVLERRFENIERKENVAAFEDERKIDMATTLTEPGSVIIDNEDPGFEIRSNVTEGYLKKFFNSSNSTEDEYVGIHFWNLPKRWKATTTGDYYGKFRHSAHFIRSGEGSNSVVWNAELPSSGRYAVYYYVSKGDSPMMRPPGRGGERENPLEDFNFVIHHDDGVDEVELDVTSATEGWNELGTYYFSKGPAKVELSDRSKGRYVYADAVKWTAQ